MKMKFFSLCCVALTLVAGCSLEPKYQVPTTPQPSVVTYKEYGSWHMAHPADSVPRGKWWLYFDDKDLNALEDRVQPSNQDLQAALARYRAAQAQSASSFAAFFPSIDAQVTKDRSHVSKNSPTYKAGSSAAYYSDNKASLSFNYEIDVWGRLRNAAKAADAETQASAADFETLDLMLHAELASDYFTLRSDDVQLKLLEDAVQTYEKALQLTEDRLQGKIASESDVSQAQTQLSSARADLTNTTYQRAQLEHAIAVLIGEPATSFSLPRGTLIAVVPPLDPGLPSSLLERRPDIASSERAVFAANAGIGIARAAYYPTFSLSALVGVEGRNAQSWFMAPSQMWSLGPSALLTVFDAGRIDALNESARATYDEAVANYRKAVLVAYRETEDALAGQQLLQQELQDRKAAAEAAQRTLDQSTQQYVAGIVNYLQVVTSQTTALQTAETVANIQGQSLNATVALIRALGGGWEKADRDRQQLR